MFSGLSSHWCLTEILLKGERLSVTYRQVNVALNSGARHPGRRSLRQRTDATGIPRPLLFWGRRRHLSPPEKTFCPVFDLAELHPEPLDFYLVIFPAPVDNISVRIYGAEVPCLVICFSVEPGEYLPGFFLIVPISLHHLFPAYP